MQDQSTRLSLWSLRNLRMSCILFQELSVLNLSPHWLQHQTRLQRRFSILKRGNFGISMLKSFLTKKTTLCTFNTLLRGLVTNSVTHYSTTTINTWFTNWLRLTEDSQRRSDCLRLRKLTTDHTWWDSHSTWVRLLSQKHVSKSKTWIPSVAS